jgi:hypothetical protein
VQVDSEGLQNQRFPTREVSVERCASEVRAFGNHVQGCTDTVLGEDGSGRFDEPLPVAQRVASRRALIVPHPITVTSSTPSR